MIAILYRWKIKADKEDQFLYNWSVVTNLLRENCGSLGSRLHKADDHWVAYAQWPDLETREAADLSDDEEYSQARVLMRDSVEEDFPEMILEIRSDYLMPAPDKPERKYRD